MSTDYFRRFFPSLRREFITASGAVVSMSAALLIAVKILAPVPAAHAASQSPEDPAPSKQLAVREFTDEVTRDYSLRSLGLLQIVNRRGAIRVEGWPLDKIRVTAVRRVVAQDAAEASERFASMDFQYDESSGSIELTAEYGKGLEIREKLEERKNPKTVMDLVVRAPVNLSLDAWTVKGDVMIRSWSENVRVRTYSGAIFLEEIKADDVSLICPACDIALTDVRATVRCVGGAGRISLANVRGRKLYVESGDGDQRATKVLVDDQIYVSKKGSISGRGLGGRVEFRTDEGAVEIVDSSGFVSGRSDSGAIRLKMLRWEFSDKALVESERGDIELTLPSGFSAEVDVRSIEGKVKVEFPVESPPTAVYGPAPANFVHGRVGAGGEQLKVSSGKGNIRILKGI